MVINSGAARVKRVFVSATRSPTAQILITTLRSLGIDARPNEAIAGDAAQVDSGVRDADVFIAWIDRFPSTWLTYELGLAVGLGKPVLALSPPNQTIAVGPGFTTVPVDPSDAAAVLDAISSVTGRQDRPTGVRTVRSPSQALGPSVIELRAALPGATSERSMMQLVERTLSLSGLDPVRRTLSSAAKSTKLRARPDMSVWVPELDGNFGNPVLIDVRLTAKKESVTALRNQLARYSRAAGAGPGLVLYRDGPVAPTVSTLASSVAMARMAEWLEALAQQPFGDWLKNQLLRR